MNRKILLASAGVVLATSGLAHAERENPDDAKNMAKNKR